MGDLPPAQQPHTDVQILQSPVLPMRRRTTQTSDYVSIPAVGRFLVEQGTKVTVDLEPDAQPGFVRGILTGRIAAFLLRQRGWLPLHASGISIRGRGVLFLGPSGRGKSTTAAAFYEQGHPVMTDDVAPVKVVSGICTLPTNSSHIKLMDDALCILGDRAAAESVRKLHKHHFPVSHQKISSSINIDRIYVLDYGPEISIETIPLLQTVRWLSENTFFSRQRADPDVARRHLELCTEVAAVVTVRRLIRTCSLRELANVVGAVEEDLSVS